MHLSLFYTHTGTGDLVRCFHCNLSLHRWVPGDDVWFDHARWSPHCYFVRLAKGEQFITDVLGSITAPVLSKYSSSLGYTIRDPRGRETAFTAKSTSINIDNINGVKFGTRLMKDPVPTKAAANTSAAAADVIFEDDDANDSKLTCKICLERELQVVFLPCGHFVSCSQCAPGIDHCAVCRADIKAYVRAFL